MSKALKCDRCKTCFDPATVEGKYATIRELVFKDKEQYASNTYSTIIDSSAITISGLSVKNDIFDLCPACTEKLIKFFSQK
jgi:hypothetical protein